MPLPTDIELPSYLQPPSQAQQEQIAMQQDAMKDKAISAMQRRIAMAKLLGDANQYQAAGMQPDDARQHALIDNAPAIFRDDPEQMVKVTATVQSALNRKKAIQGYRDRLSQLSQDESISPAEAAARAWSEFGPDIVSTGNAFGSSIERDVTSERSAAVRREDIANKASMEKARDDRIRELATAARGSKEGMFQTGLLEKQREADQAETGRNERAKAAQTLREREVVVKEKQVSKPSAAQLKAKASLDEEIRATERSLNRHIAQKPAIFGKGAWEKTKTALEDELRELKAERAKLDQAAPEDTTAPDEGAAPAESNDFQQIGGFKVRIKK